ncbi:MAG: hypothetical protein ACTSWX_00830 [Promethearchaeota archaeon]
MAKKEKKLAFDEIYRELDKKYIELSRNKIQDIINSEDFKAYPIEKRKRIIQQLKNFLKLQEKNIDHKDNIYSDNVPESISMKFRNYTPLLLDPKKLKHEAFSNITTLELTTKLSEIRQSINQNIDMFNPKPYVDREDPDYNLKLFVLDQIEQARKYSRNIHYSIVSILVQIHLYISKLIDNIDDLENLFPADKLNQLIAFKKKIEIVTLRYNQHDPAYNLLIEENKLRALKVVKAILINLAELFSQKKWGKTSKSKSTTSKSIQTNTSQNKTTKKINSVSSVKSTKIRKNNDKTILKVLDQLSDYISISRKKSVFSVGVNTTSPPPPPLAGSSQNTDQNNNSEILTDTKNSSSSETTSTENTPVPPSQSQDRITALTLKPANFEMDINLSEITDPENIFSKLQTFSNMLITYGIDFFTTLKNFCYKAKFNLYFNNFGSSLPQTNNSAEMENIYADLNFDLISDLKNYNTIKPVVIVETTSLLSAFLGKYTKGNVIFSVSLLPGEKKELRMKTTELLKEEREKNQTILESKSEVAKNSFQAQLEREKNKTQTISSEANQYLDAQKNAETSKDLLLQNETNLHKGWSAEAHADASASVEGDLTGLGVPVGIEATSSFGGSGRVEQSKDSRNLQTQTQHQGLSKSLSQGVSRQLNTGRDESARVLQNTLSNHCQEVSSKRDVTVSETSKQQLEESKEQGTVQILENKNKNAVQNYFYCATLQEYIIFHHITDISIVFSNGITWERFPLSSINILIDKYIKPEFLELRKIILDLVKLSCRILDYKNRVIDILDKDSDLPKIKKQNYLNFLLERENIKLDTEDMEFLDKFKFINGVLINKFTQTIKQPGLIVIPVLKEGNCMDIFSQRELDARVRIIEEESRKITIKNDIMLSNKNFAESITDQKLSAKVRFEIFKDDRDVVGAAFVGDFVKRRIQNNDDDEIDITGDA